MADVGGLIKWSEYMTTGAQELEHNRMESAERAFGKAVDLGRDIGHGELLSFSLRMLGIVKNRLGSYVDARLAFSESLELARRAKNIRGQAEAIAGLANVAYALEETQIAEDLFVEACDLFAQLDENLRKAMVLCDLGALYCNGSMWGKSIAAYEEALGVCRQFDEKKGEAEILVMLGEVCRRQEKYDAAVEYLQAASKVFAGLKDWRSLASTLQYLGLVFHDMGLLEQAAENHRRSLALWCQLGESEEIALVLFALGKLSQALGELEEAKGYFLDSIEMVKDDPEATGHRQQSLGGLYLLIRDLEEAENSFLAAQESFAQIERYDKMGEILETLGFLRELQEDNRQAETYYLQAIEAFERANDKKGRAEVVRTLGLLYEGVGDHKRSLENLWQALNLYRELELAESEQVEREIQRISRRIRKG